MNYLWHYAPATKLPLIEALGALRPSNVGAPDELAMLWFSAHQQWEPTATKMVMGPNEMPVQLTFAQQVQVMGCVRFGLPAIDVRLLNWKNACAVAGTSRRLRQALEKYGRQQGANPLHWFATKESVLLSELRVQSWCNGWVDGCGPHLPNTAKLEKAGV